MRICAFSSAVAATALLLLAAPASAQLYESVGTRAQGMGGAFVGVADDATASWWNPAGLATGAYFNVVLEKGAMTQPADPGAASPAARTRGTGFAAAFPALGLSSYRLQVLNVGPINPTAPGFPGRQPEGGRSVRQLLATQFGVTIGQSLGDHLVVGSTLKLVRGGVATGTIDDADTEGLDRASELEVDTRTRGDLDVGAMAWFGKVKLGVNVRNVTRPTFGEGSDETALPRQARGGFSVTSVASGFDAIVLAADADLTRTTTGFGDVRHVAVGGEAWLRGRRFGFRGGLTANTIGERRPSYSTGVSVAPIRGLFIEASKTIGSDESLSGWTSNLRFSF
jgi:hypothetical protein